MLDSTQFNAKPTKEDVRLIQSNLTCSTIVSEQLAYYLSHGCSFRPGILKNGLKQINWVRQQVFALDIDDGMTIQEAITKLKELHINACFIYTSFSHTEEHHKFRIIFVSDCVITDAEIRDKLQATLMGVFHNVDPSCKNRDRLFFGGRSIVYEDYNSRINADNIINTYWDDSFICYLPSVNSSYQNNRTNIRKKAIKENKKDKKVSNVYTYVPDTSANPIVCKPAKDTAKFNIKCLDNYYIRTTWVEGSHRERFIFIYYNCAKIVYGTQIAYNKVNLLNILMDAPLTSYEFNSAIKHTDEHIEESTEFHSNGVFTFSPKTIISEEWLDIPTEIARECGFFDAEDKKKKYEENRKLIKKRDDDILFYFLVKGYNYNQIAQIPSIKCDKKTVSNTIKRYELSKENKGNELLYYSIDFDKHQRYKKKGKNSLNCINKNFKNFFETKSINNPNNFYNYKCHEYYQEHIKMSENYNDEEERKKAVTLLNSKQNVFICGKAGCGKTHLIVKEFYENLSFDNKIKTVFLAPTGQAATNLPYGKTIHSFFRINYHNKIILPDDYAHYEFLENIDRIIIDEIGQVRLDLFHFVIKSIKTAEYHFSKNIQIILSGDFGQIRPVLPQDIHAEYMTMYNNKIYAFEDEYWSKLNFNKIMLRTSKRQNDDNFVNMLDATQFGYLPAIDYFNQNINHSPNPEAIYICGKNRFVDLYNSQAVDKFENKIDFAGIFEGDFTDEKKKKYCNNLSLAVGMRVMTTMNSNKYKNGSIGTITAINSEYITVLFDSGSEANVTKYIQKLEGGTYSQFPIKYAYAITADKSQGMTLDEINIVGGSFFSPGQLYTALSRCRSFEGIHIVGELTQSDLNVDSTALSAII